MYVRLYRHAIPKLQHACTMSVTAHHGLAVPPSPGASNNSIVVQCRAKSPAHINAPDRAAFDTVPPMSMLFRLKGANTSLETQTHVRNVFANANCINAVASQDLRNLEFRGVSIGPTNGKEVQQFGESRNRLTTIIRGVATIMVNNAHLKTLKVGDLVGYEFGRARQQPAGCFMGFDKTPTATLVRCRTAADHNCIGEIVTKPGKNDFTNWCTVLLYGT